MKKLGGNELVKIGPSGVPDVPRRTLFEDVADIMNLHNTEHGSTKLVKYIRLLAVGDETRRSLTRNIERAPSREAEYWAESAREMEIWKSLEEAEKVFVNLSCCLDSMLMSDSYR